MKKIDNLKSICGGRVESVIQGDKNLELKDGNIFYKVLDDKTNKVRAYFLSYAEAINYDRLINYGFIDSKYVKGPSGLYEESDCYEIASMND